MPIVRRRRSATQQLGFTRGTPDAGCRRNRGTAGRRAAPSARLRRCSHCPAKLVASDRGPRVGEHAAHLLLERGRLQLRPRVPPARAVASSGGLLQRKNDRRDASATSLSAIRRAWRDARRDRARSGTGTRCWRAGPAGPSRCRSRSRRRRAASRQNAPSGASRKNVSGCEIRVGDRPPVGAARQVRRRWSVAQRVFVRRDVGRHAKIR